MKALPPAHVRHVTEAIGFLGLSLLLAGLTSAKSSVEVITCEASSQKARMAIDRQGRAGKDVRVTISLSGGQPFQRPLAPDESGLVVLPPLKAGQYVVTAVAPEDQGGSICVEISKKKSHDVSSFKLLLRPLPPGSPTLEQTLAAAEQDAPTENIQQFQGLIVDPGGATNAGAEIMIFPKGAKIRDDKHSVKVKTGSNDDFSVVLPDGVDAAVFLSSGFKQQIVTFEVLHTGAANGMRISLELGAVTE